MNDAKVVLRYVGEVRAAGALSHRLHVRCSCFQAIIHPNVSLLRYFDPCFVETDAAGVGSAPQRHEDVSALHGSCLIAALELKADIAAGDAVDTEDVRV
jgi:hypothetical protein